MCRYAFKAKVRGAVPFSGPCPGLVPLPLPIRPSPHPSLQPSLGGLREAGGPVREENQAPKFGKQVLASSA